MTSDNGAPVSRPRRQLLAASFGVGIAGMSGPVPARAAAAPILRPLTAQTTEGPYYFDARQDRADIVEGQAGVPLDVRFTICDTDGHPLPGMRVDIWHCNATGIYSGYAGQGDDHRQTAKGKTFLRGYQRTGSDGVALFHTIYPGWYEGRTTHIHVKVIHGTRAVLTSQFFLPDALSEYLYTQLPAYARLRTRDTLNSSDGIALMAGDTVLGAVRQRSDRYEASLVLVVDPAADPVVDRPPAPGEGPPPDGLPPPGAGARPPGTGQGTVLRGAARVTAIVPGQDPR